MTRVVVSGVVVALIAAVVAVVGESIGITTVWPVLLAVAIGLSAAPITAGRVLAYVLGAVLSWVVLAVDAALLPDVAATWLITAAGGVLLLTVASLVTLGRLPLFAGLAGFAAFLALYEPMRAANPTAFLSESPVALVTVLLAAAVGAVTVALIDLVTGGEAASETDDLPALSPINEGEAA